MTQSVEVSVLLLDSVVQTIRDLMDAAGEDVTSPDHQATLDEVELLLINPVPGADDGSEEEGSTPEVEACESGTEAENETA